MMPSVLVMGGGPAGASFATRMAQLGSDVTLIERAVFPRAHPGESLSAGIRPLLVVTGAWPSVDAAGFPSAGGVRVMWAGDETVRLTADTDGLRVDRGRFDQVLIAHAARQGVRVLQPAHLVTRCRSGTRWAVELAHASGREVIIADLIADARGRAGQAGSSRCFMGERTLAVFAYWRGGSLPQALVSAHDMGWYWGVPLPDGHINAQVFLDPSRLKTVAGATLEQRYRDLISRSPLAGALSGAEIVGDVSAVDCTASRVVEPVGDGLIRVGDAGLALDPISASGVQKAIQTALSGAIVANTLLRQPSSAVHAQRFYRNSMAAAASRHSRWAAGHYATAAQSRADPFWSSRASTAAPEAAGDEPLDLQEVVTLAPLARFENVPCLGSEFVEIRRALVHPSLEEPVAYLSQQPLSVLLGFGTPASCLTLVEAWSRRMPAPTAVAICRWLRRRNILVPVPGLRATA